MSVYFCQQGADGPVKIGFSRDPARRLLDLSTSTPFQLDMRAVYAPGTDALESAYHLFFNIEWIRGEWFHPTRRLLREVQWLAEGGEPSFFDPEGPLSAEATRLHYVLRRHRAGKVQLSDYLIRRIEAAATPRWWALDHARDKARRSLHRERQIYLTSDGILEEHPEVFDLAA